MEEVVMQMKKKKLKADVADLMASAYQYAERAEATGDKTHVVKSNSLRKSAKMQIESKLKGLPLA